MRLVSPSLSAWVARFVGIGSIWLVAGLAGVVAANAENADSSQTHPSFGWVLDELPGADGDTVLKVLRRAAPALPARYSVVVVPGSGCTGWLPVANRYFAGLLHAELLVLHKPGVDVDGGLNAVCDAAFVQNDTLSSWRDHSKAALRAFFARQREIHPTVPNLPVLLVGISEGAEVLPDLAPEVPHLAGVVLISAPGLDPAETGELQARRIWQISSWLELERLQRSQASDDTIHQGRTMRYWRDFWRWKLAQPLLDAPWPLLRVWGGADAMVPDVAYQIFGHKARARAVPGCEIRLPGADHGLQNDTLDGLQWLWARMEIWARNPGKGFCDMVLP